MSIERPCAASSLLSMYVQMTPEVLTAVECMYVCTHMIGLYIYKIHHIMHIDLLVQLQLRTYATPSQRTYCLALLLLFTAVSYYWLYVPDIIFRSGAVTATSIDTSLICFPIHIIYIGIYRYINIYITTGSATAAVA